MLRTSQKVVGSRPDELDFFDLPNPSSHTRALGSTQPLTEMSIPGIFLGSKGRPARKSDNLTATCVPIVLENVRASTSQLTDYLGLLQG
jgi:hypothetical protein